ncbi:MAG TPA: ergothioneine biosynthesis protein EgtB, partial [Rubricoccaceae bacterium]
PRRDPDAARALTARTAPPPMETATATTLAERFRTVRALTESLCDGLQTEDFVVQSMADVSPTKWHLAHTTWFWETFVLAPHLPGYVLHDDRYPFLFNSYYVQAGERHCRAQRGYLSRPTVAEVFAYRAHVDAAVDRLLDGLDEDARRVVAETVEIGLHHEQQHQELMLTDLKHVFSVNPLRPVYRERPPEAPSVGPGPPRWRRFEAGVVEVGATGAGTTTAERFHFDNEGPRHRQFVEAFEIADRLVTAGEVMAFVADGGYTRPELWLSLGWATVRSEGWAHPFYWEPDAASPSSWRHFTLAGTRPVDPDEPAVHLSYFEADAVARWMGARLPSEFEWETAAQTADLTAGPLATPSPSGFVEGGRLHPAPAGPPAEPGSGDGAPAEPALRQMAGEVWQWTHSQYTPYPGYRPVPGALGEYNGKFMANQFVLRGASVATSRTHVRPTYRNFFPPETTWQFTGLRLARSAGDAT